MKLELKPCPFCGAIPKLRTLFFEQNRYEYYIECDSDECVVNPTTIMFEDSADAIKSWNIRV